MDGFNNFNQFLNQVTATQRKLFESMTAAMPGMHSLNNQNLNNQNMSENWNKVLDLQEQAVTNSLKFQTTVTRLTIEAQQKIWQNYFNLLRGK